MMSDATPRRFIHHSSLIILLLALTCAKAPQPPAAQEVRRVVSLAPNITEIAFAAGCGAKIVGTDNFSDAPAEAAKLPKVGGVEPDIEKIVALKPDLVIASSSAAHPALRRALAAVHVRLLVIRTDRMSEIATAMTTIGHAAGCNSEDAVNAFNRSVENNRRFRKTPPRLLFAAWTDPLYIAGRETFLDDVFALVGAQNAVDVKGWPQYSLENFMAHPPDVLLYPGRSVTAEAVQKLLGRAHLPIRAIAVDENVFTRPGPRLPAAASEINRICDEWERSH